MNILEKYTEFHKVKEMYFHDRLGLVEFLNNVVMNKDYVNGDGRMLSEFSDIYVLVSNEHFPFDKLELNHKISIDLSVAKESFVLGYIWVSRTIREYEGCSPYHFINSIDTRISGLNMAKYMIEKYEMMNDCCILLPQTIVRSAQYYWKKYFMEVYDIKNKADLLKMITGSDRKFGKDDIQWMPLIEAFEM